MTRLRRSRSTCRASMLAAGALLLLLLIGPASASAEVNFGTGFEFATGTSPHAVAVGDLNGDGKQDLVVANWESATVSVMLGNGDGTFEPQVTYAVGARPDGVVIGDFNGDGNLDIAVSSETSGVSILLGTGTGTFGPATTFSVAGYYPQSIAVGDFNGDGKLDLAVDSAANTIAILLGNGNGTFEAKGTLPTGGSPQSIATGDFNGDGKTDLAVVNLGSNTVSTYLGAGTGAFGAQTTHAVGSFPQGLAVGDFNGDGHQDLAVTNTSGNDVSILFGTGTGSFEPQATVAVGSYPTQVAAADLNGDGSEDLVVTNQGGNTVSVLLGTGTGTFEPQTTVPTRSTPSGIAVGDFNGDGSADLAVINETVNGGSILIPKTTPTMTTEASPTVALGGSISDAATLAGGSSPTGSISFEAFGPDDATCSAAPVYTSPAVTVAGDGSYASEAFVPSEPGTYRFVAAYSGDGVNEGVTGTCGEAGESVVVGKATPTMTTEASATVALGGSISDAATLAGGSSPTGSISFEAFGPDDANCSGTPAFTNSAVAVAGNGSYASGDFVPSEPGTYRFVSAYSGDGVNEGVTGTCGEAGESVLVEAAVPATTTTALTATPETALFGTTVTLTATVSGAQPTGTVSFADDGVALGTAPVEADGTAGYAATGLTVGSHSLTATYLGDDGNAESTSSAVIVTITAPPVEPIVEPTPTPAATTPAPVPSPAPAPVVPKVKVQIAVKRPPASKPKLGFHYTFRLSSQVSGVTFFCRLDGARFARCKSPKVYAHVKAGKHVFRVKAVSANGVESVTKTIRFVAGKKA